MVGYSAVVVCEGFGGFGFYDADGFRAGELGRLEHEFFGLEKKRFEIN